MQCFEIEFLIAKRVAAAEVLALQNKLNYTGRQLQVNRQRISMQILDSINTC